MTLDLGFVAFIVITSGAAIGIAVVNILRILREEWNNGSFKEH